MEPSVLCTLAKPWGSIPTAFLQDTGFLYVSQTGLELIVILLFQFPSLLEMETSALYH